MGHSNTSQALDPAAMSQLQFMMGSECTSPSFPEILVLEGQPSTRDRDGDVTHSSSSSGEGTGLTAHTQPGAQQGFAAEQFAFEITTFFPRVLMTPGKL